MGIYLPNMKMPKCCGECKLFDASHAIGLFAPLGWCRINGKEIYRLSKKADCCPLVPVPPHGRMIDADAAIGDIRGEILEHQMNGMKGTPFYIEDLRTMWQRLEDEDIVPTIIPAEEET